MKFFRVGARVQQGVTYALAAIVLLLLLTHVTGLSELRFVRQADAILYDIKARLFAPMTTDERIVIVDVDDRSLAELGRWPWRRDLMAEIVDKLFRRYGARAVGFDMVFAEPDQGAGLTVLDQLEQGALANNPVALEEIGRLRPQLDRDGRLASAIQNRPVALGFYFSQEPAGSQSGQLPKPVLRAGEFPGHIIARSSYGANLQRIQEAAAAVGHFNVEVDPDGVSRHVPLLARYGDGLYESLSLALLRVLDGTVAIDLERSRSGWFSGLKQRQMEWLRVSSEGQVRRIPVDDQSNALIPYRGPPGTFRYISISDVAKDRVAGDALRGKIALIGASAGGLLDLRVTPVSNTFIGVEMHANLLSGMLDGTIRQQPGWIPAYEVALLAVVGVLVRLTLPRLNPLRAVFNALGMAALLLLGNFAAWQLGYSLPVAASLILVSALLLLQMFWGYTGEVRSKREFARLFGQYVPPELVAEMSRNPEHYSMEGQNCELTVLFCDLRGFTSIAERIEPRQVTQLLGEFLTAMTAVIGRHRGTVDKYIGDAIMAFWGAPVANSDHARAAVETALEMQREMMRLSESLVARGLPALEMGVGINTGQVTVGDFGSSVRKAYTAIGDAVNLASRLEGLTRSYGMGIVVGESTRRAVSGFAWRELDRVRVKGKGAAVTIYEPLGPETELDAGQKARLVAWQETLEHFRARRWSAAESGLRNLAQREPGWPLYALYLERIAQLRAAPPAADWDGVVAFEFK